MSIKRSDYKTRKEWRWAVKQAAHDTGAPLGQRRLTAGLQRTNERMAARSQDFRSKSEASRAQRAQKKAAMQARKEAQQARHQERMAQIRERREQIRERREERRRTVSAKDDFLAGLTFGLYRKG